MSAMSNYLENALFNAVYRSISYVSPPAVYVALHTANPDEDASGLEVSGGSYARQGIVFGAPTNGEGSNTSLITFPEATAVWGQITHFSLWDALTGGNMLMYKDLDVPKPIGIGDVFKFKPGQIVARFL